MTLYATKVEHVAHLEEVYDLLLEAGASEWQSFEKTVDDYKYYGYSTYPYVGVDAEGDIVLVTRYGAEGGSYKVVSLDKLLEETKNLVQYK